MDRLKPKGFAEAFTIYELRHELGTDSATDAAFCERWEQVYSVLDDPEADGAAGLIESFLRSYPSDGVARHHAERLLEGSRGPVLTTET